MKSILLALFLLLAPAHACGLDPKAEFVEMGDGMEGGIAPADPTLMVLIIKKPDGSAVIYTRRPGDVYSRGKLESFDKAMSPIRKLGLLSLPVEPNPGMSDAYAMSRSMHVHLGGKCWMHMPAAGCVREEPKIKPTAAQKETFSKATSEIAALAGRAREKSSRNQWDQAWKQLEKEKPAPRGPVPGSP